MQGLLKMLSQYHPLLNSEEDCCFPDWIDSDTFKNIYLGLFEEN